VYEYYKGGNLPDIKYLSNTLIDKFDLAAEFHEEFINIYNQNLEYLSEFESLPKTLITHSTSNFTPKIKVTKTTTENILFVIMPFTEKTEQYSEGFFDEVFNSLIVPAAAEAGFTAVTAN
jgi:hypothetical protein